MHSVLTVRKHNYSGSHRRTFYIQSEITMPLNTEPTEDYMERTFVMESCAEAHFIWLFYDFPFIY